jgi:hypothetical protein
MELKECCRPPSSELCFSCGAFEKRQSKKVSQHGRGSEGKVKAAKQSTKTGCLTLKTKVLPEN